MKNAFLNILLIDYEHDSYQLISEFLDASKFDFKLDWCQSYDEGVNELDKGQHDVYLIDYNIGEGSAVNLILDAKRTYRSRIIIFVSSETNEKWETRAIENGASDYLEKSELAPKVLERSIRYARSRNLSYKKLKEQRQKYLSLFQSSIDPIVICDLDYNVTDYNQAFIKLVSPEVVNSEGVQLTDIVLNSEVLDQLKSRISSNTSFKNYELQIASVEGILDCLLNVAPLKNDLGTIEGYQVIIHDITEIKQQAIIARENDRVAYTGKLAQLIAHEVRNPLTNINLAIGQLQEIEQPEPEERSIYFDIVQRNSNRINELISQLLDSSQPSVLSKSLFLMDKVISNAIKLCYDRINLQNVDFTLDLAGQKKDFYLDHEKMEIALLNIMTNALEAMSNQEQPRLSVTLNYTQTHAVISIQDNGKGMSQDQCQRIFEPFYTSRPGGKGLGMTLSKNIISSHNGDIKIISELGRGTTFIITIPTE